MPTRAASALERRNARLVLCSVDPAVRKLLDAYGLTDQIGTAFIFGTVQEVVDAYRDAVAAPQAISKER
jgi:anti-anti-sigma regulatory factor